jgi:hypothetical protein
VLVVVGIPVRGSGDQAGGLAGTPALAALAAVRAGARVELVGKAGEDPAGDAVILALGRQGVGHAALLRDPGHQTPIAGERSPDEAALAADDEDRPDREEMPRDRAGWPVLEPEDVQLALRYLPEVSAIIVAEPQPGPVLAVLREAAGYLAAPLVVVAEPGEPVDADIVLAPPSTDPDGAFAGVLGQVGAALDRGLSPDEAFREVSTQLGLSPA